METTARKREWVDLYPHEQEPYLRSAEYLIEKGYPLRTEEKNIYILAEILYNRDNEN